MEFKILTSTTASGLNQQIKEQVSQGFKPVGSHQVITTETYNRFSGMKHLDTIIRLEYSQSMIKE